MAVFNGLFVNINYVVHFAEMAKNSNIARSSTVPYVRTADTHTQSIVPLTKSFMFNDLWSVKIVKINLLSLWDGGGGVALTQIEMQNYRNTDLVAPISHSQPEVVCRASADVDDGHCASHAEQFPIFVVRKEMQCRQHALCCNLVMHYSLPPFPHRWDVTISIDLLEKKW